MARVYRCIQGNWRLLTDLKGGEFASVYIGYGVKYGGSLFVPQDPGKIEGDPNGTGEFKEPNEPPKKEEPPVDSGKPKDDVGGD